MEEKWKDGWGHVLEKTEIDRMCAQAKESYLEAHSKITLTGQKIMSMDVDASTWGEVRGKVLFRLLWFSGEVRSKSSAAGPRKAVL